MMNGSSEPMEKVTQGLMQACDEMQETYCNSVDAAMDATSALAKGCEEFGRKCGALMQEQMSRAMIAGKTMVSAKSIQEIADLQTEFMKSWLDQWMAGTGRLSEISTRMTQEALTPVAKHASDTMSKAAQKARQSSAA